MLRISSNLAARRKSELGSSGSASVPCCWTAFPRSVADNLSMPVKELTGGQTMHSPDASSTLFGGVLPDLGKMEGLYILDVFSAETRTT